MAGRQRPALTDAAGCRRPGCLIIVCGLPGSGKTTSARRLAEERGSVRLAPDEWMSALGVNLWDTAMRERVEALQWSMAKDLLRAGVTATIEWGTWGRGERDALRVEARALGRRWTHAFQTPDEAEMSLYDTPLR